MATPKKLNEILALVSKRIKNAKGKSKKKKGLVLKPKLSSAAKEKPFKNPVKDKAMKNFKNSKKRY